MNCVSETSALNVKNRAIPNRTRVSLPPWRDRTTLWSSSTDPNANAKAFAEMIQLAGTPGNEMFSTMASAAPKIAADDIPSVNGLASGLFSVVCISAPASDSAAPTSRAMRA
jgi:hypothetical protein